MISAVRAGRALVLSAAALCGALGGAARAAPVSPDQAAAAEVLFQEARDLMDRGETAAACPKLEASLQLDEALGTLLNLATCYERTGRTASAWARYRQAAEWGRQRGDVKRTALAEASAAGLEPTLPRLTIRLESASGPAALIVRRDGSPVDAAAFGIAMPVDPGPHEVQAQAPGRAVWRQRVEVAAGESFVAVIPATWLAASPVPAHDAVTTTPTPAPEPAATAWQRPLGIALFATGIVAATTGLYFGRRAATTARDVEQACRPAAPCEWSAVREKNAGIGRDQRRQWILLGAGAAAMAGGATVFLLGGAAGETTTAAVGVRGRF
jgi:hypothetical protein